MALPLELLALLTLLSGLCQLILKLQQHVFESVYMVHEVGLPIV